MEKDKKFLETIRKFFSMIVKSRLPYFWMLFEIIMAFVSTNIGVRVTELTAEMFAGNLSWSNVILPFIWCIVFGLLFASISGFASGISTAKIDRNMRKMLWKKIVNLPYRFFHKNEPGEIISRLTTDITAISTLLSVIVVGFATTIYSTYTLLKTIGDYNTTLLIATLVVIPVQVAMAVIVGRLQFHVNNKLNQRKAELTQSIAERTDQTMMIKSFGTEAKEMQTVGQRIQAYYHAAIQNAWLSRIMTPVSAILTVVQFIVLVMVGRHFYASGAIDLAQWIAFFAFANKLITNLTGYINYWINFRSAQGSTWRVAQIMDEPEEDITSGEEAKNLSGDITVENITFAFNEEPLFQNASVTIPCGKTTAIVGKSGSGKSTLLNMIDRLFDPDQGSICIGGVPVTNYSKESYHRVISYMTQEALMFSGSIRDNLTYGMDREITDAQLEEACQKADILKDIQQMPYGFETEVGEAGAKLSGGQRQKLALVRLFLQPTDYLLMDEGTAAMDAGAKDALWNAITRQMQGKTIVFVAHDMQTLQNADYIVVLDAGQVVSCGEAKQMLQDDAYFKNYLGGAADEAEEI